MVTATPGDGEVALSWTQPPLGGREFNAYLISWRVEGTDEITGSQATSSYGATTATVTGLKNGTTYEFAVKAYAGDNVGPEGLATATPVKPVEPQQPGEENCTLSSGYWSTHSEYGPSLYDATWAQLSNGADTPFFLSGQSYYEVINADPEDNAYYILAQQYIAAELNFLRGADPADVQSEFDAAKALFEEYTPADIAGLPGYDPLRAQFIDLAYALDQYNMGVTGPGYCME
ncbi:MAG: hypothetical protein GWP61_05730 [Chloroflexi bacterium]|nr:hypothetical protein [Chloroflexota bacterium]